MITFTKSYKTQDNNVFGTLEAAQSHEIKCLFENVGFGIDGTTLNGVAETILKRKDVLIDILTTTSSSKPRARAVNGGTKKRHKTTTSVTPTSDSNLTTNT